MEVGFIRAIFFVFLATQSNAEFGPIIKTSLGHVVGFYDVSYEGRHIAVFKGIPYAKPPIGSLRFEPPQPIAPWPHFLVANKTYICPQNLGEGVIGSEDCLYMYVYVPKESITGTENFSVIAHIHGEDFTTGAPDYYGNSYFISDKDLIFVTFNYRLGALGFFSTGDEVVPGNNGLKDQVLALKWIRNNIKYFGGNPDSVTLTGVSAGAVSVHCHYFSPMSKGISHSGTALNPLGFLGTSVTASKQMAVNVKCNPESSRLMIDCLRNRTYSDIVGKILLVWNVVPMTRYGPVVENGNQSFISEHPYKLLRNGEFQHLPWITSNVKNEAVKTVRQFMIMGRLSSPIQSINQFLPDLLYYSADISFAPKSLMVQDRINDYYFDAHLVRDETAVEFIQLLTDRLYLTGADTAIRMQSKTSRSSVHYLSFEYKLAKGSFTYELLPGVANYDDARIFYNAFDYGHTITGAEKQLTDIFLDFLSDFAATGNVRFNSVKWEPVIPNEDIDYMHVGSAIDIGMKTKTELAPMKFWNRLTRPKYNSL